MRKIISVLLCIMMFASLLVFDTSAKTADEHEKYTMMANNILMAQLYEKETPTTRLTQLLDAYEHYAPDVIALQECDAGWHEALDGEEGLVTLGYASAFEDNPDIELSTVYNPIYYKKEKFKVIASGFTKYATNNTYSYTWAVLEAKASGDRFAVSSTHFIWGSLDHWPVREKMAKELEAAMRSLEAEYGVPFISMGDYNSHLNEAAYRYLSKTFKSARSHAAETVNMNYKTENGVGHAPGVSYDGISQIDHCFYSTNGIVGDKYEVLVEPMSYAYADHVPHILTFWVTGLDHKHTVSEPWEEHSADEHRSLCYCREYTYAPHNFSESFTSADGDDTHARKCVDCGYEQKLPHNAPNGEYIDTDTHLGVCADCGVEGPASHVYVWTKKDAETCDGVCSCGAVMSRSHVYEYTSNGEDKHTAACACTNTLEEAHVWNDGKTVFEASYAASGIAEYTCELCGETKEETIDKYVIPDSAYELYEGGQMYFSVTETEKAPVADGRIKADEYTLVFDNINVANDEADKRFYFDIPGVESDVSDIKLYVSYDSENIYFAAKVKDSAYDSYGDAVTFFVGTSEDISALNMYYMPRITSGVPEVYPWGHVFDDSSRAAPQAEKLSRDYLSGYKVTDSNGVVTYEIAIKRDMLPEPEAETLFFAIRVVSAGFSPMHLGFNTRGLDKIYPKYSTKYQKLTSYPHVLTLEALPESEPETEPPVESESFVTEPADTGNDVLEIKPVESETDIPTKDAGCGGSMTSMAAAIIAMLGTCVTFIKKKNR